MRRNSSAAIGTVVLVMSLGLCSQSSGVVKKLELPPETAKLKPSNLAGYAVAAQKCGICHSTDYISFQPPAMTKAQWTAEMQKMQHVYGAPIEDNEINLLGIYLAATYGDASSVTAEDRALAAPTADSNTVRSDESAQALLNSNGCLSCHSVNQKIVGPAYHEVAVRYKSDTEAVSKVEASIHRGGSGKWGQVPMPAFGSLSPTQLKTLAAFVLAQ
jgi:cytochrome c